MTTAVHTAGTKLQRGDGATPTEAFTTIAEVVSISGPTESARQVEVTNFDSAAKEYIAGLRDSGELSFECNFIPESTMQQGLRTDLINRVKRNFKLILNDNTVEGDKTTFTFAAVVTSFAMNGATDDAWKASVTLKISGAPTILYSDRT